MPVVVIRAMDLGVTGYESCAELEANEALKHLLERIRLNAGQLMGLGDVAAATIPKLTMVAAPVDGGAICTRTFIPHRCHQAIGVLGAVTVATACLLPGSTAAGLAQLGDDGDIVRIEHPTGTFDARVRLDTEEEPRVITVGIVRTARKLMDGTVFPRSY
jgi:4-oxalomesaconate tautomerase